MQNLLDGEVSQQQQHACFEQKSFLYKLNHIAHISTYTIKGGKTYMCIKYNVLQLNKNVSRGLSRSYMISDIYFEGEK